MSDWNKIFSEMRKKVEELENENQEKLKDKGFKNQYFFSIYVFLKETIPELESMDVSHLKNGNVIFYNFFDSELEYRFITCIEKFIYPGISALFSIPKVEGYKDEIIKYYIIKKHSAEIIQAEYNFKSNQSNQKTIDLIHLETQIESEKKHLEDFTNISRYERDLKSNPQKYRSIDAVFEGKALELGKEFLKKFLTNKNTKKVSEIFNTKDLETDIIKYLPKGNAYFKFANFYHSIFIPRSYTGNSILDRVRIGNSMVYFYLFWNKYTFYIKGYISCIYSKHFKQDNVFIIDSIFSTINSDRERFIDKYLPGEITESVNFYSRKNYSLFNSYEYELKKIEKILEKEDSCSEGIDEDLKTLEKQKEDFKSIQNLFK